MVPPHARFKFLPHNRLLHRSSHLFNRAEPQHPSIIFGHEDDLSSLDRTQNTSVDGLNQGSKPPEEPEIDRMDCTSSGSDHLSDEQATSTISSFEAGDLSSGSPRHVKECHVARQHVMISTSIIYETTYYMSVDQAVSTPPSTSTSPTLTSPIPTSPTPTSSHSTSSSPSSSFQCDGNCSLSTTTLQMSAQQTTPISDSYTTYTTFSTSSDAAVAPTSDIPATTATMLSQPVLASAGASSSSTVMVSSPLAQPTSVPDTNSDPQSPPHTAAIVGGAIGAVALLALLIFIVIWHRRKRRLSVTPFILPSTTAQIGAGVCLNSQSTGDGVRPNSRGPSLVQYSDAGLIEHSGNRYLSFITDSVSSHLPDDPFASVIVLGQQSNGLGKLYPPPSPSHARNSDHYRHSSVENWVKQVVLEDCSREPSEELPAYRSTKSLGSGEADHDDHYVPPGSSPPVVRTMHDMVYF
ncbi:uncharacterized protein BJ212DRAFT_1296327 [Suillus subaureus]|uniref:Uncharacterized protein n=1 Tax=Suillus subaureus TaxID=48587 RepID=A0A9P7EKM3_9AGAM|nr:uncharacterized protein BJ212DRAFT_1296327 [Suillus subaureus]KAG1823773.1 hypothetical protein BJ212DRAFT_1296327 [Suillus subaureus]